MNRLTRELETANKMIRIYCRAHHAPWQGHLCEACQSLADYVALRVERCPYGDRKPTCARCPIHCYRPDQREQIRAVMRYAGPRMLFRHPLLTLFHLVDGLHKPPANIRGN